ncbi:FOG: RRM domain [Moesziomyces antarcticus T-34]|uniref:FOG: RRM domain n=1 Tax=Pseudozyma antarctica (strain T-34) TaxID=1151754 RepID=M9MBK5_PSEA3|nr:FOG: RRM domain [Moesziomyces antarcticus T-34]
MTMPSLSGLPGSDPSASRASSSLPIRPLVHVANLPSTTTERALRDMFASLGPIQSVKVVASRNSAGLAYGFVEFVDVSSAERAVRTLDGWLCFGIPIKVCWAKQSMHPEAMTVTEPDRSAPTHSNAGNAHLFVGDLSPDVDDSMLYSSFSRLPSLVDVRVMYDAETGKSRGFGFVSFRSKRDAETCIAAMQGQWLGGRQIRVNWANQKNSQLSIMSATAENPSSTPPPQYPGAYSQLDPFDSTVTSTASFFPPVADLGLPGLPRRHTTTGPTKFPSGTGAKLHFDQVLSEAPASVSSVYVGNLSPLTTAADLVRVFAPFNRGHSVEARIPPARGYGFVTLATHEYAASAISTLSNQGVFLHSRWLRLGWQKEREKPALEHRSESLPLQQARHPR